MLAVRYLFVDVTINGGSKGIYALEEHFEKYLIEAAGHREGDRLDSAFFPRLWERASGT